MDDIKTYYAKLNNMGDLLSEYLIPKVTGKQVRHCERVSEFQVMGIGSCGGAIWGNKEYGTKETAKDILKKMSCLKTKNPCAIWGTGFLKDYYPRKLNLLRTNVEFVAVRGALSQRIIENSLGKEIHPVLCDGGILASELLNKRPMKKYVIGFIPHYNEQTLVKNSGIIEMIRSKYKDLVIIDLRDEPMKVIQKIGECEYIISSSLHGCVVADSFGIPNRHIVLSDIPGTGFKFDDYYSGYGIEVPVLYLQSNNDIPSLKQIEDDYIIKSSIVEEKKKQMRECLINFINKEQ